MSESAIINDGLINEDIIAMTKYTCDRILDSDNKSDAFALYTFYAYMRTWQNTSTIKCTMSFVREALDWGVARYRKAKNTLKDLELIEDVRRVGEDGRTINWYVNVKYVVYGKSLEVHPSTSPSGGQPAYKCLRTNNSFNKNIKSEMVIGGKGVIGEKGDIKNQGAIDNPFSGRMAEVWDEWVAYRKEMRKPLTPTTIKRQVKKLKAMGDAKAILAIETAMDNGWQGFFEPQNPKKPKSPDGKDWSSVY